MTPFERISILYMIAMLNGISLIIEKMFTPSKERDPEDQQRKRLHFSQRYTGLIDEMKGYINANRD